MGKRKEYQIFGPPGTGKTTYLSKQIEQAAEKHGSENIMVASFTKAAAHELNSRNLPIPKENIGTLHALCYRALGSPPIAETKTEEFNKKHPEFSLSTETLSRLDEMYVDQNLQTDGDKLLSELNLLRARCLPLEMMRPVLKSFHKTWELWKFRNEYIDFMDMISIVAQMKDPPPGNPKIGIYDECQDFNKLEFNLIRHWAQFQDFILIAGDDDQCHPTGTLIKTVNRGEVPIETLNIEKDILWSLNQKGQECHKAQSFQIAARQFSGLMCIINDQLSVTYNHRMIVRWKKEAIGAKAVYLMRRGDNWRIGITDLIRKKARRIFGVGQRARQEKADAVWILSVHKDGIDAMMEEERISMKYHISQMCFVAPTKGSLIRMTQKQLDDYHQSLVYKTRIKELFRDYGLFEQYPLWKPDGKQRGITVWQEIQACNLIPCYMEVPEFFRKKQEVPWQTISKIEKHFQICTVYSLNVYPYRTYIANGIAVHNSIYTFTGASPDAFLSPDVPQDQKRVLGQSWRLPRKIQDFSIKWISRIKNRQEKHFAPRNEEGEIKQSLFSFRDADRIVDLAWKYAEQGKSIMLLTSCGYMLDPIKAALRRNGIPFHNPYRKTRSDWNPLGNFGQTRKGQISTKERLLAFLRKDDNGLWSDEDLQKWTDIVKIRDLFKKGGKEKLTEAQEGFMPDMYRDRLEFFRTIFNDVAFERAISRDLVWFHDILLASKKSVANYPLTVYRHHGIEALEKRPKIIISTIHGVKGGEADVVLLFPDLSVQGIVQYQQNPDPTIRQFYVGMTRAKETLLLGQPATGMSVKLS